jgi:hypothetical protein
MHDGGFGPGNMDHVPSMPRLAVKIFQGPELRLR